MLRSSYTTSDFGLTEDTAYNVCGEYNRDGQTVYQLVNDEGYVVDVPAHMLY